MRRLIFPNFVAAGMLFSDNNLKKLTFAAYIEKYQLADTPVDVDDKPFNGRPGAI
jgi:hypothetical protein